VETGTAWAVTAAEEPAVLFLPANTVRHLWYFCWYRRKSATEIISISTGYGLKRLSARGTSRASAFIRQRSFSSITTGISRILPSISRAPKLAQRDPSADQLRHREAKPLRSGAGTEADPDYGTGGSYRRHGDVNIRSSYDQFTVNPCEIDTAVRNYREVGALIADKRIRPDALEMLRKRCGRGNFLVTPRRA
jgi:hypothetical protein